MVCIVVSVFFISTCHYVYPYFRGSGSVTFIDVGQGDAILIRLPYDKGFILLIQVERFVLIRKNGNKKA